MQDSEGALINMLMDVTEPYITPNNRQTIKNGFTEACYNYDIQPKKTELAVYDGFNERALRQFLATKRIEGRSPKTLERYEFFIRKLMEFYGDLSFREMTTSNLRFFLAMYQQEGGDSNTTMDGIRRIYTAFFNWLSDEDFIEKSPAKRLAKIKHDTMEEEPYTEWEMEALMLATSSLKDKAILEFLYSTACRVSELCEVKITDINTMKKNVVLHGKGNKDRIVPLTDKAMFYINEIMKFRDDDCEYLFITSRQPYRPITADAIRHKLIMIAARAGVKHAHPHRFRVTRITTLLRRGMKLEEVQLIAGHEDISTTAMYNRSDMSLVESEFRRRG